jgi:hypothetical protein
MLKISYDEGMNSLEKELLLPANILKFIATGDQAFTSPHLDSMSSDINNVIASIAARYNDPSCPPLNYQDLLSEGSLKLAELNTKGLITRLPRNDHPTRSEWFKFFKTVVNNHIKGLVHKNRGTLKRTGHRIPTKDQRNDPMRESNKPIEISLDDPDSHLQLAEPMDTAETHAERELIEHVKVRLTPLEKLVFDQLVFPNGESWFWAFYDSFRGHKQSSLKVRVKEAYQAKGLGMDVELFLSIQESIQKKFMSARDENVDIKYNMALTSLSQTFKLQIPDSIRLDKDVVARLFTMISRRESEKVDRGVAELLKIVGARVPEKSSSLDACFGVMFENGNKICATCGVKEACASDALTHGIDGTVFYSPKLMGSKSVRIPVLVGRPEPQSPESESESEPAPELAPVLGDERDEEISAFLSETFAQRKSKSNTYLDLRPPTGKSRYIFWIGRKGARLQLRFCNPALALKKQLVQLKNGFYLPDELSTEEAIKLINKHANERLMRK